MSPFKSSLLVGKTYQVTCKKKIPSTFSTCVICSRTASAAVHSLPSSGYSQFLLILRFLLSVHCPQSNSTIGFPLVSCFRSLYTHQHLCPSAYWDRGPEDAEWEESSRTLLRRETAKHTVLKHAKKTMLSLCIHRLQICRFNQQQVENIFKNPESSKK